MLTVGRLLTDNLGPVGVMDEQRLSVALTSVICMDGLDQFEYTLAGVWHGAGSTGVNSALTGLGHR